MSESLQFAFSSRIFPSWDLAAVIARAREVGFDGVTLSSDLLINDLKAVRGELDAANVKVASIASRITPTGDRVQDQQLANELKRLLDAGAELGAASVRILDPRGATGQSRADLIQRTAEWILPLADEAGRQGIALLVQNANALNRSRDLWSLLDYSVHPSLGVAWDQLAAYPETAAVSIPTLNARLQLPILRDANVTEGRIEWKNLGEGQLQVPAAVSRLQGIGFRGWVSFEMPGCDDAEGRLRDAITRLRDWTKPKEPPKPKVPPKPVAKVAPTPAAGPAAAANAAAAKAM